MKFAHLSDCHLGGWRQPELQQLNLESFKVAIKTCIEEQVEFILFSGDLFDTAFPSIEILKETFSEFRKIKDAGIKSYVIAGSHDYSVSGKTFLDVLEKAGFCEICEYEEKGEGENKEIILKPIIHKSYHIYGYPGKKSGLEVEDLRKIKINEDYENNFRILMLHTTIDEVKGDLPIDSINLEKLPKADYYALGHIHIDFEKEINSKPVIYSGPLFPNNFSELEKLKCGGFYILNDFEIEFVPLQLKEVVSLDVSVNDLSVEDAFRKIIDEVKSLDVVDKIVTLRVSGSLASGKVSDINFKEILSYLSGAYSVLKNTNKLSTKEFEDIEVSSGDVSDVEDKIISENVQYGLLDKDKVKALMEVLSLEKVEGETVAKFEDRLLKEVETVLS